MDSKELENLTTQQLYAAYVAVSGVTAQVYKAVNEGRIRRASVNWTALLAENKAIGEEFKRRAALGVTA